MTTPARLPWALAGLALALFIPLFATGGLGAFDFWWWMGTNAALLLGLLLIFDRGWRRALLDDAGRGLWWKAALGLSSAGLLYGIFWLGNILARRLFGFAASDIDAVYALKDGVSVWRVALLMGLLIGPAEELFWRAFLQRRLGERYGAWAGLVVATLIYTGMHVASLNPMLVLAAGVCGLFWGLLYLRFRSVWLNVISHTLWDLAVFLIIPFG